MITVSGIEFPVIYNLQVEGAAESRKQLEDVAQALMRGDTSFKEFEKAQRASDRANSQVATSLNRVTNAFRAAHPNLAIFERTMGRIGGVARTIVGLFDSWNILQIAMSGKSRDLADANDEVEKKTRALLEAQSKYKEGAPEILKAQNDLTEAQRNQKRAIDDVKDSQQQAGIQLGLYSITAAGGIASTISMIAALGIMKGVSIAALGGVGGLVVGVGALAGSIIFGGLQAANFHSQLGKWPNSMKEAALMTTHFADTIPVIGGAIDYVNTAMIAVTGETMTALEQTYTGAQLLWGDLLAGWGEFSGSLGASAQELWSQLQGGWSGFSEKLGGIWTGLQGAGKAIWEGLSSSLIGGAVWLWTSLNKGWNSASKSLSGIWEGLKGYASTAWNAITGTVKGALNSVIGLLNRAIGALNSISVTIPDWVPIWGGQTYGVHLPSVPYLKYGTSDFQGGPAIVGESGPELVYLPQHSQVIPNSGIGGRGGVNITVNIRGFVGSREELVRVVSRGIKQSADGLF